MNAREKSSRSHSIAKWVLAALAAAVMFAHPVLGAFVAVVLLAAWACGRMGATRAASAARETIRAPAYPVAEATMQCRDETASPTTREVMRCWMLLF